MVTRPKLRVQRGHYYAIVDEVDSILIDEARTPLIISGAGTKSAGTYKDFASAVRGLVTDVDYEMDEAKHTIAATETGLRKIERALKIDDLYADPSGQMVNHLQQALKAQYMNGVLILFVLRQGNRRYLVRTIGGIIALGVLIDAVAPFVSAFGESDLLLCALWGGVITGVGLGLVFRTGGNTGGTDIIAQVISSKTSLPMGTACIIVDSGIIALSALTFSVEQALYAAVAMTNEELREHAREVRRGILVGTHAAGSGHPGGSLSSADIMRGEFVRGEGISEDSRKMGEVFSQLLASHDAPDRPDSC